MCARGQVTLAPELQGSAEVIQALVRRGIKVSLGHTTCSLDEAEAGYHHGATMITHLYDAPNFPP